MLKKLFFWRKRRSNVADKLVVSRLKKEGAVPRDLLADGYTMEMRKASNADQNPPNPWLVLAGIVTIVNEENVERARNRLTELTSRYGGEYDGWEAAVR